MGLSLYFDIKNFWPANFSRIVIAALVCASYSAFYGCNIPT